MSRLSTLAAFIGLLCAACDHQRMENQPRFATYEVAGNFADGRSARKPPDGAVTWRSPWQDPRAVQRFAITPGLLARGRERYDIYCTPCHGYAGEGDGIVVQRGFPAPPSYHEQRLRDASDGHLYDVISNGYGLMFSYGARVPPADRRAIVAYVRALQLSQHAPGAQLPQTLRKRLDSVSGAPP